LNSRDIERFLAEDEGFGDITTALLPDVEGTANIIAHEDGVVAGLSEAQSIFAYYNLVTAPLCCDGDVIKKDDTILRVIGAVRAILVTERVALNFLCAAARKPLAR
jgi:nicotinate-nucleotide pyrophosphorylase (carboxylating)